MCHEWGCPEDQWNHIELRGMVVGQRWWSRWGFQIEHDQQFYSIQQE